MSFCYFKPSYVFLSYFAERIVQRASICCTFCCWIRAAAMTLRTVLLSLQALLAAGEPDDPQDAVVATQYKDAPEIFNKTARHWSNVYANGMSTVCHLFNTADCDLLPVYLCFNGHFTGELVLIWSLRFLHLFRKRTILIRGTGFLWIGCNFCHPSISVKALFKRKIPSTDAIQVAWSILS